MRQQLVSLLAELKKEWTLLIVPHDAGDLLAIADKCWQIDRSELTVVNPHSLTAVPWEE